MADDTASPARAHLVLRQGTRDEHSAAEQTGVMRALLHGDLNAEGYRRLLLGQYALHRAWESTHANWIGGALAAAGWPYQSRCERLVRDFAEWELQPGPEHDRLSPRPASRFVGSPSASWGELYVIEGSALGGQLIARHLERLFPDYGHAFFRIGRETVSESWRTFQSMLDRHLPDPVSQSEAVSAAKAMFHRAQRMLEAVHG